MFLGLIVEDERNVFITILILFQNKSLLSRPDCPLCLVLPDVAVPQTQLCSPLALAETVPRKTSFVVFGKVL